MPSVNYPTSNQIPGPWLLSSEQLISLDRLLDGYSERLDTEKERYIQEAAEEDVADYIRENAEATPETIVEKRAYYSNYYSSRSRDRRKVIFFLPQGKTVTDEKFGAAITHPHLTEAPTGLSLFYKVGEIQTKVEVRNLSWSNDLELTVEPSGSELSQELFGALQNWVADLAVPQWLQIVRKWRPLIGLALLCWLAMGLMTWALYFLDSPKMAYKAEAHDLLKKGITSQDQQRAIELLLAINSEYYPAEKRSSPGARFWSIFLVGAITLASLTSTPSVVIGVWGGKTKLRFWRWWIRFIGVTIPMLIFTSIIWKWLLSVLK